MVSAQKTLGADETRKNLLRGSKRSSENLRAAKPLRKGGLLDERTAKSRRKSGFEINPKKWNFNERQRCEKVDLGERRRNQSKKVHFS